ncbi:MAG: hypothetical protein LC737_06000 [Chloroflexi bacterium]|nr:hypothetical protein [Chloroflexota bacterium]
MSVELTNLLRSLASMLIIYGSLFALVYHVARVRRTARTRRSGRHARRQARTAIRRQLLHSFDQVWLRCDLLALKMSLGARRRFVPRVTLPPRR